MLSDTATSICGKIYQMNNPTFEVVKRPWFGPRKRAKQMLAKRNKILRPEEFISAFKVHLKDNFKFVQKFRFYDYTSNKEDFHYTIVLVWTDSDVEARDTIFSSGEEVVFATGWYPLLQGAFLDSCESVDALLAEESSQLSLKFESSAILGISSATSNEGGGCSIRLHMDNECILLDTGFPGAVLPNSNDRIAFLSHTHLDHSGGVAEISKRGVPIVTSPGTAFILAQMNRLPGSKIHIPERERPILLNKNIKLSLFPVPHMPGAAGLIIEDQKTAVIYTGDICLRTSRHDFTFELEKLIDRLGVEKKVHLLLDATMASRREGGASTADSAKELLSAKTPQDIIVTAKTPDHLITAYLDFFHQAKSGPGRGNCSFLVGRSLRPLFRAVHTAFIRQEYNLLDPFIFAQYGKSLSSWAESCWLFWLPEYESLGKLPQTPKRFWFVSDLDRYDIGPIAENALCLRLGRDQSNNAPKSYDSSAWNLHSDDKSLAEAVRLFSTKSSVILFHNFEERLQRFISYHRLQAKTLTSKMIGL